MSESTAPSIARSCSVPAVPAVLASLVLGAAALPATASPAIAEAAPSRTVVVVARTGSDSAAGTAGAPLRSISAAVERAPTGSTIVVRGGRYHESVTIPRGKQLRLTAAPGARVWLDGSRRVRHWHRTPHGFVHRGWRVRFDASPTYTWGAPDNTRPGWSFVNDQHPMAAHPDQVWVGNDRQRQVGSRRSLRPGTFFVDKRHHRLHLGSAPRGRPVRASTLATAISIRGAGSSVHRIGVRRFAPSVPHMGAVTVEARDVRISRMSVVASATTGLHVSAADALLRRVHLIRNGMLGMSATYADRLRLRRVTSRGNNTEHFNYAPVAGGIKIGRTQGVRVVGARIAGNAGTGLWFDESTRAARVYDSRIIANRRHGLALEISDNARVADTVIAGNHGDGVKVNDTSHVALWNNTIVGNGRPLNIVQDGRRANDPHAEGHDPRFPVPAPGMTWVNGPVRVHNNILGRGQRDANCLLCVEDYSDRFTAREMRVRASGNVYERTSPALPRWAVVWSRGAGDPTVFDSVAGFERRTGQEQRHLDLVGRRAVTRGLRAAPVVRRAAVRVAKPLSARLAHALGRHPGARHLGAWLG